MVVAVLVVKVTVDDVAVVVLVLVVEVNVVLVIVDVVVVPVVVVLLVQYSQSTGHRFCTSAPNGGGSEQLSRVNLVHFSGSWFPLQFIGVVVVVVEVVKLHVLHSTGHES